MNLTMKRYSADFQANVPLEVIRSDLTPAELLGFVDKGYPQSD